MWGGFATFWEMGAAGIWHPGTFRRVEEKENLLRRDQSADVEDVDSVYRQVAELRDRASLSRSNRA